MGRKHIVPYGLYRAHGFISAHLAERTGFSEDDLKLFWQALGSMFEHDRSAARGEMAARRLLVFKHKDKLGNAPAHKLFESVEVDRANGSQNAPRGFGDYIVTLHRPRFRAADAVLGIRVRGRSGAMGQAQGAAAARDRPREGQPSLLPSGRQLEAARGACRRQADAGSGCALAALGRLRANQERPALCREVRECCFRGDIRARAGRRPERQPRERRSPEGSRLGADFLFFDIVVEIDGRAGRPPCAGAD
jgi:hypothetical protein